MSTGWNHNRVSEALAIEYPIIQGPLGGLSSHRLTTAVSNFGGLGSFGAHGLEPNAIEDVIAEIRSLTEKPFAMNLWVSMEDPEPELRMLQHSVVHYRTSRHTSKQRVALRLHSLHTRPSGLRIRPAFFSMQMSRHSRLSSAFRQKRSWTVADL
jgi:NAD(P)H-dependent flavin oxidoreductase YrpB (nitropropane dioxygenase family)